MKYTHCDMSSSNIQRSNDKINAKSEKTNTSNRHYNQSTAGESSSCEHIIITVNIIIIES